MSPGTKGVKSKRWNYGVFLLDFSVKNHVIDTKFTFFRLVIFWPLFSRIWNFVGTSHLFFLFFLLQNERTNVIGFGLILTSLRFCPERVVVGEEAGNTWIHFGCGARVTGWRTGRQACHPPPLVSFSLILITLGPSLLSLKSPMVTINKKNGALLARPKKNCCAIRWPKCPRLRKVQNENKGCSRKRKMNWIYHDNKQSFLFFFSLVHNILLIFCFIQLHKRLENITKQTVRQQQKAKLSLFLLITVFFSTVTDFRVGSMFNEKYSLSS